MHERLELLPGAAERPRFLIRTFGCQMNVHDAEKVGNLLLHRGWAPATGLEDAQLVIVNTCSIREKAEHRLYSDLGVLRAWKEAGAGRVIGVGGCVAQQEGDALLARSPQLDFVFGTHNLRHVPALADAARSGRRGAVTAEVRSLERFDLPERHPEFRSATPGRAFLTVMEGCDMFCSFCIVPQTRGREISRPAAAILDEARDLARRGVVEVTLLGQTVNAYGRHDERRGRAAEAGTEPFAALVRRIARIPGIERIRYTSPHPLFFDAELVRAHGEIAELCPHVHLPAQSGSDGVLARMRRRYGRDRYLGLVEALRAARPGIAITTDLIVGFPGETDADFEDTLALVREARFVDAFCFKYSPRPGTAAAEAADVVPEAVKRERLEALQALQRSLTLDAHRRRVGETVEILVEGPSRHGGSQIMGRDPQNRVVNADLPRAGGDAGPAPGERVRVAIVEALPHCLIGDLGVETGAPAPL
ncbi:MAG TPA: tRNA (N6-isopentenyl adenosine(37)-C2)-methylthiotransferase MiaB [Myxococcota bacterium]|jgi:tRNA-2-methylthio-N6-dimethylallyladenosine synthase|nr:tRNA (N6-isopentenyl adenosine(37)-C2)-methylthiotransferase MiaB [Myxococcota bacterium]